MSAPNVRLSVIDELATAQKRLQVAARMANNVNEKGIFAFNPFKNNAILFVKNLTILRKIQIFQLFNVSAFLMGPVLQRCNGGTNIFRELGGILFRFGLPVCTNFQQIFNCSISPRNFHF